MTTLVPEKDTLGRETYLTLFEVAERLKVNEDTARRLFLNEPGVIVICFPTYSTFPTRTPDVTSSGEAR